MTRNPDIRFAKSIVDYIFRWMAAKFLSREEQYRAGVNVPEVTTTPEQLVLDVNATAASAAKPGAFAASAGQGPVTTAATASKSAFAAIQNQEDAPPCSTCGSIMVRAGACYKCANCGTTSGCG
jgi:ribonucleoside-diphosphate reductase alpha chain